LPPREFVDKYGVNAPKKGEAEAQDLIIKKLNDRRDFDYYAEMAAKKRVTYAFFRGKPSETTKKLAVLVALYNANII
jgi:hypothetical protein